MATVFHYTPYGVCSRDIAFSVEDDIVTFVKYTGGCNGNLQGISKLVTGMNIYEVISKLENIKCGFKNTSCPDQLSMALKDYLKRKGE